MNIKLYIAILPIALSVACVTDRSTSTSPPSSHIAHDYNSQKVIDNLDCRFIDNTQSGLFESLNLNGKRYAELSLYGNQPGGPYLIEKASLSPSEHSDYSRLSINGYPYNPAEIYIETNNDSYYYNLSSLIGCNASGAAKSLRLK
jgi:hypothetical protein